MDTLTRALRIHDSMKREDREGTRPLYRPEHWNIILRRKEKEKKKYELTTKGGHIAPIFFPPPPNSELAESLRIIGPAFLAHTKQKVSSTALRLAFFMRY